MVQKNVYVFVGILTLVSSIGSLAMAYKDTDSGDSLSVPTSSSTQGGSAMTANDDHHRQPSGLESREDTAGSISLPCSKSTQGSSAMTNNDDHRQPVATEASGEESSGSTMNKVKGLFGPDDQVGQHMGDRWR